MKKVTIANGASVSGSVELGGDSIVGVAMPAAWTAAQLGVEASVDGTNFSPCYDAAGDELLIAAAASRYIVLAPEMTKGLRYVRLRSGTVAAPVNQGAAREISLELAD